MKIVSNERRIKRNARIGQGASIVGLLVLFGGLIISFQAPDQFALSWGALLVGFILSQVGLYYSNRWGRRPRPDEELSKALKGLTQDYTLYHYSTPAHHVLVGPAGIWVLSAYKQQGQIQYSNGKWKHSGVGRGSIIRRWFGQEGLGRPDLEIGGQVDAFDRYLKKSNLEADGLEVQAALVFTGKDLELEADESPVPALPAKKLKAFILKQARENRLPKELASEIQQLVEA